MRIRFLLPLASAAVVLAMAGMAAAAASQCNMRSEEWPVRVARGKVVADGAINGQKVGVMLDTGATRTLIFRPAAERLGLSTRPMSGEIAGIGGLSNVEWVVIEEFSVGRATRKAWRVMVAGDYDPGDGVALLLGEDFLHRFDVEFDLAHNAVRLFKPEGCERASLAYWATEGAGEVAIEPLYDADPQILLTVKVDDQPVRALLDSGAGASMLDKAVAARLGVTPETPGVIPVGRGRGLGPKRIESWVGPFRSFTIGDELIENAPILFGDLWRQATYVPIGSHIPQRVGPAGSMLLGVDFLRAHRLLVAHSQHKIYFTYAGGPVFGRAGASENGGDPAGARP